MKVLWTLHDAETHDWSGRADAWGHRVLAQSVDVCICHDEWAAQQFRVRFGGRPEKVILMSHGNYDGIFPEAEPRELVLSRLGLDPGRKTLACVGNIRSYKRIELAVEMMGKLNNCYQLIIAGKPYSAEIAEDLQKRAVRSDSIRLLLKRLSDAEFANYINAADCVLFPYERITGSGALLAVASLGRGVVTTDLPYFRQFLAANPAAGVIAGPGVEGLVQGVNEYFHSALVNRGASARAIADLYPWEKVVEPVVAWYRTAFPDQLRSQCPAPSKCHSSL